MSVTLMVRDDSARDTLRAAGAKVEFVEYNGGHGDVFGNLRTGIEWPGVASG